MIQTRMLWKSVGKQIGEGGGRERGLEGVENRNGSAGKLQLIRIQPVYFGFVAALRGSHN